MSHILKRGAMPDISPSSGYITIVAVGQDTNVIPMRMLTVAVVIKYWHMVDVWVERLFHEPQMLPNLGCKKKFINILLFKNCTQRWLGNC